MSDRQSAGLILLAIGLAGAVYYYRLGRTQRTQLRVGLLGK